jgi:UDP-galactopyranose mutase
MSKKAERILVVGAGVTGLAAAEMLRRRGKRVQVWEARSRAGGLLEPVTFMEQPWDRGSHRLHPEADDLVFELTGRSNWLERPRRGRIVIDGRQLSYPLGATKFLRGLGVRRTARLGAGMLTRKGGLKSFLQWENARKDVADNDIGYGPFIRNRVGRATYDFFYRPYAEKVWGIHPDQLSQTVAKQRVSTSKPWQALKPKIGKNRGGTFMYPQGGMVRIIDELSHRLHEGGVKIRYKKHFAPGMAEVRLFDAVVYTGHLSELVPGSRLPHRGLYILYINVEPRHLANPRVDTFYLPEARYHFGRVSMPQLFERDHQTHESRTICIEIPEGNHGREANFTENLEPILAQLAHAGILKRGAKAREAHQIFLPRVYPLHRVGWLADWQAALARAARKGNFYPVGRQGLYLHCNIDHCVDMAAAVAEHIDQGNGPEGWPKRAQGFLSLRVRD